MQTQGAKKSDLPPFDSGNAVFDDGGTKLIDVDEAFVVQAGVSQQFFFAAAICPTDFNSR